MTLVIRNRLDPDNGRQIFIPVPPPPEMTRVTTTAGLKAALLVPGSYSLAAGTYTGNFDANVADVSLVCDPGVIFGPSDTSDTTFRVLGSNFSLTGTWSIPSAGIQECIVIGSQSATTQAAQPDNVLFDGGTIIASDGGTDGTRSLRAFGIHGSNVTISHCHMEGFYRVGQEVQAIWVNNTNGPITITDCYLEAAGENFLCGGELIHIPNAIPSDIYFARNVCFKPMAWFNEPAATRPDVKNLFELKNAQRVLIEDNIFDGCWAEGQAGDGVLLTSRNQYGTTPWTIVNEVTFRRNVIRNILSPGTYGFNILGTDSRGTIGGINYNNQQTRVVILENNLVEDADGFLKLSGGVTDNLTIDHNTKSGTGNNSIILFATHPTLTTLTLTNNAMNQGYYGFQADSTTPGTPTLNLCCNPGYNVTANLFGKTPGFSPAMPAGNTTEAAKLTFSGAPNFDVTGVHASMDVGWDGPYLLDPPT